MKLDTSMSYFIYSMFFFPFLKDDLSCMKKQLSQGFLPDDAYPLGAPLFMETLQPCSPHAQIDFPDVDEVKSSCCFSFSSFMS